MSGYAYVYNTKQADTVHARGWKAHVLPLWPALHLRSGDESIALII